MPARVNISAPAPDATGAASIAKSDDGHYWAEALVNGKRVRFLVDTGATAVALTAEDAQRLGFEPKTLNYGYQVTTANGLARAAEVKLASVSVAGARVEDVQALVIEKGLPTSLLGMTLPRPPVPLRSQPDGAHPAALRARTDSSPQCSPPDSSGSCAPGAGCRPLPGSASPGTSGRSTGCRRWRSGSPWAPC